MLTRLALLLAAGLGLSQPALADRFYFGDAQTESKIEDGTADYVDGVLVHAEDGMFTIRVVGGVLEIPETMVYKIERDMLTVKAIQSREQDQAEELARANASRQAWQAERDRARRERAEARRALEEIEAELAEEEAEPEAPAPAYDPIIRRVR